MMPAKVLDSWALMAFFKNEPSAAKVEKLVLAASEGKLRLLLSVINWGEIYYSVARANSVAVAEKVADEIKGLPLELIPVENDLQLIRQAALYKTTRKMSYADCFPAALAKINGIPVVTGDDEFKEVEDEVKVEWR